MRRMRDEPAKLRPVSVGTARRLRIREQCELVNACRRIKERVAAVLHSPNGRSWIIWNFRRVFESESVEESECKSLIRHARPRIEQLISAAPKRDAWV